jgi:uncharacterized protein (DUF1810 family)
MSVKFALKDSSEAEQYWQHPILGPRLSECFEIVQNHTIKPQAIFSSIDYFKYKSSYQLFSPWMNQAQSAEFQNPVRFISFYKIAPLMSDLSSLCTSKNPNKN